MGNLTINNGGVVTNSTNVPNIDLRYGPYENISEAYRMLGSTITPGLTVGLIEDGEIKEYIVNDDFQLTPKLKLKTINNQDIVGEGNITIQEGGGTTDYTELTNKPSINGTELDGDLQLTIPTKTSDLTNDSNFATTDDIDGLLDTKQDLLRSGENIVTINGESLLGGGNITITTDGTLSVVDNLTTSDSTAALSASQGKELARRSRQISLVGANNTLLGSGGDLAVYCIANHKYRIILENTTPDITGVSMGSTYTIFGIRNSTISNTASPTNLINITVGTFSGSLDSYYDVVTPYTGLLWILARATEGEKLNYWIEDITEVDKKIEINKNTVNLFDQYFIAGEGMYIKADGSVSTSTSINSAGVSDYIDIHDLGTTEILSIRCVYNNSVVTGIAVYDENKTFLRKFYSAAVIYSQSYYRKLYNSDYYIRVTFYKTTLSHYIYRLDEVLRVNESPIYGYETSNLSPYTKVNNNSLFLVSHNENLLNPLRFIRANGVFLNSSGSLTYSASGSSIGVTDYIPFGEYKSLKINQNDLSGSYRHVVYDSGYNVVRIVSRSRVTKESDSEVYVRFTVLNSSTTETMVCNGDYEGDFVSYGAKISLNPDMYNVNVTIDNITPTTEEFLGENICDPNECHFGNDKYISRSTGNIESYNSSTYGGYTGYIPIDSKGLTFSNIYYGGTAIGGAVYDKNKNYIRSAGGTGVVSYQEGDAFVRFTLGLGASANNVMVNKGTTLKDYTPYGGKKKVISPEILPSNESSITTYDKGVDVFIPNEVVITRGSSLQLFYRSMVKAVNPYAFNLQGTCLSGAPFPRYTRLDTVYVDGGLKYLSTGTRTFTMKVINNNSEEVAKATTTIRIIPNPTSPETQTNILLVGASTFAGGQTISEINRRLTGTSGVEITQSSVSDRTAFYNPKGLGLSNISFVGRLVSNGVHHEAKSGRQIAQMVVAGTNSFYTFYFTPETQYSLIQGSVYTDGTRQFTVQGSDISMGDLECLLTSGSGTPSSSGTLTLVSGSGSETIEYTSLDIDNTNPFWNSLENKIDFQRYSTQYLNSADISILIICLGINDMFNNHTTDTIVNDYKSFIRAYHNDFPNGKVIMFTASLPDINGGMGISYGSNHLYWSYVNKYFSLWRGTQEMANETEFTDFVKVCASAAQFDSEYLYYRHSTKTSNRATTTEQTGYNALHYGDAGFNTMADSIYYSICGLLQ